MKNKPLSIADTVESQGSESYTFWLAHRAACELSAANDVGIFQHVLQTYETEPLECLHALIGSYLEDRSRTNAELITDNEPF